MLPPDRHSQLGTLNSTVFSLGRLLSSNETGSLAEAGGGGWDAVLSILWPKIILYSVGVDITE